MLGAQLIEPLRERSRNIRAVSERLQQRAAFGEPRPAAVCRFGSRVLVFQLAEACSQLASARSTRAW